MKDIKRCDCNVLIYDDLNMQYISCACADLVVNDDYDTYTDINGNTHYKTTGLDMYLTVGSVGIYNNTIDLGKDLMKRIKKLYVNKEVQQLESQIKELRKTLKELDKDVTSKRAILTKIDKLLCDNFDVYEDDYYD